MSAGCVNVRRLCGAVVASVQPLSALGWMQAFLLNVRRLCGDSSLLSAGCQLMTGCRPSSSLSAGCVVM